MVRWKWISYSVSGLQKTHKCQLMKIQGLLVWWSLEMSCLAHKLSESGNNWAADKGNYLAGVKCPVCVAETMCTPAPGTSGDGALRDCPFFSSSQFRYSSIPQNHRMAEPGRDLWIRLTQSLPTSRSTWLLEIFEEEHPTASQGNLCQCSITSTVKRSFLMFRQNLPCFILFTVALVLSLGTTKKNPALSCPHAVFRYFYMYKYISLKEILLFFIF